MAMYLYVSPLSLLLVLIILLLLRLIIVLHNSDTYKIALLNIVSNLFVCPLINHMRVNYNIILPFVSRQFDRCNHCITFVLSAERNNDVDIYTEQTGDQSFCLITALEQTQRHGGGVS